MVTVAYGWKGTCTDAHGWKGICLVEQGWNDICMVVHGCIMYSKLQRFLNLKSATVSGGTFYSPDIKNVV